MFATADEAAVASRPRALESSTMLAKMIERMPNTLGAAERSCCGASTGDWDRSAVGGS